MNTPVRTSAIFVGVAAVGIFLATATVQAQDRPQGGFDPKRMQQMMLDRLRQQMEIKDDAEWGAISNRVMAVVQARRSLGLGGGPGGGGPMIGPPPGGRGPGSQDGGGPGGPPPGDNNGGPGRPGGPGPGGFNREPNPELDALSKAVESKASNSELKARLADLKEARKKKQDALERAQDDLRQVLSVRQEAIAATLGLL
jgi:hypothetical protein